MSGRKSREKGARGEREAARFLTSLGFECTRNARNGISTGDLHGLELCLPGVVVEVKFGVQGMAIHTARLREAWEQAAMCAGWYMDRGVWRRNNIEPVTLWKIPRVPWYLTWLEACGLVTTTGPDAIKSALLWLSREAV